MPRGDRTGPNGQGPMTGRGLGPCGRGFGVRRGFGGGRGRGFGRGFRWRFFAPAYPEDYSYDEPIVLTETEEKKVLEQEVKELREEMKQIEKRLKELSSLKSKQVK